MESNPVEFSVVIPLYNKGPHVDRAIQSVLKQDFPAAEIIVVDDASTDQGPDIVRRFRAVTMLRRFERGPGGYAARNLGIETASSEWIAFLDADDRWRPDHLSSLAAAIGRNHGNVGCAFTRPAFVTAGSTMTYPVSKTILTSTEPLDLHAFLTAWLDARTCPMWTGAVAIRRSILRAAGMFPAGAATRGGDKDVWLRVMALTKGIFVPNVTAEFHQETINRVTDSLDHSVQPILCRSVARLLKSANPDARRLLRRLNNMEVVYYARYAAGAGAPFNREALTSLCAPAMRSTTKILSYATAGTVLRLLRSLGLSKARPPVRRVMELETVTSPSMLEPAERLAPASQAWIDGSQRARIGVAAHEVAEESFDDLPLRLSA